MLFKGERILKKSLKTVLSIVLALTMLTAMAVTAMASIGTARYDNFAVTAGDIEWKFIPSGNGFHVFNEKENFYLTGDGNIVTFTSDASVVWTYEQRTDLDRVGTGMTLFNSAGNVPLRYSPNMQRFSNRRAITEVVLFEKQVSGGNYVYNRVDTVTPNETYLIVGMNSDAPHGPMALVNVITIDSQGSIDGNAFAVTITNDSITFGEAASATAETPATTETPPATTETPPATTTETPPAQTQTPPATTVDSGKADNVNASDSALMGVAFAGIVIAAAAIAVIKKVKS